MLSSLCVVVVRCAVCALSLVPRGFFLWCCLCGERHLVVPSRPSALAGSWFFVSSSSRLLKGIFGFFWSLSSPTKQGGCIIAVPASLSVVVVGRHSSVVSLVCFQACRRFRGVIWCVLPLLCSVCCSTFLPPLDPPFSSCALAVKRIMAHHSSNIKHKHHHNQRAAIGVVRLDPLTPFTPLHFISNSNSSNSVSHPTPCISHHPQSRA